MAAIELSNLISKTSDQLQLSNSDCNLVIRYQWDKIHDHMVNYDYRAYSIQKLGYIEVKRAKDTTHETIKKLIRYLRFIRSGGRTKTWRRQRDTEEYLTQKLRNFLKIRNEQAKIKLRKKDYRKTKMDSKRLLLSMVQEGSNSREGSQDASTDM